MGEIREGKQKLPALQHSLALHYIIQSVPIPMLVGKERESE